MESVADEITVVPVRTPTLPPATHTNCYVVGTQRLTIIDPASPYPEEQAKLALYLKKRFEDGEFVERIVLTHHHGDHVGGVEALRRFCKVQGMQPPVLAHEITKSLLASTIGVDETITDKDVISCGSRMLQAHFTPGHAPGHLVFQDLKSKAIIAGDMVAGVGTIVIEPHEGDLGLYLQSLQHMRDLNPAVLLPAHGPPMAQADAILAFYIAHRHQRTEQIRAALAKLGNASPLQIAPIVYHDIPVEVHILAARQIHTHLRWMREHGIAIDHNEESWTLAH